MLLSFRLFSDPAAQQRGARAGHAPVMDIGRSSALDTLVRAGGRETPPVHHLRGQRHAGQLRDSPIGTQLRHRRGLRWRLRPRRQLGLHSRQLRLSRCQATPVGAHHPVQRRLVEDLTGDPRPVRQGPLAPPVPDPAVPQQHRVQPLLHPFTITQDIPPGPNQVPHRLLRRRRHPDRGQLPGSV